MNACSYTQVKEFGTVSEQPKACAACRNVPVFWRELQNSNARTDEPPQMLTMRRASRTRGAQTWLWNPKVLTMRRTGIAATAQTRPQSRRCRQIVAWPSPPPRKPGPGPANADSARRRPPDLQRMPAYSACSATCLSWAFFTSLPWFTRMVANMPTTMGK